MDILNTIGLSMMLMGVVCWIVLRGTSALARETRGSPFTGFPLEKQREDAPSVPRSLRLRRDTVALILTSVATALLISLLTPLLWTTWRPRWLPWPLESYINGVHNLGTPQAWLFPVFPWTAFAFAGLAVGFILQSPTAKARETTVFLSFGGAGIVLVELARWLDALPRQLYPVYDFWHTSPNFFLIRLGMLLMILTATYTWCRWGLGQWGFSPLIQLGQASLVVYWVHIEFVYGRFSILTKHAAGIGIASVGLLIIFLSMLALAYGRTHTKGWMKGRGMQMLSTLRPRPARAG